MKSIKETSIPWHAIKIDEVFRILKSSLNGITEKEAGIRLKHFGPNKLPEEKKLTRIKIFLDQLRSPLIYILIIAGIITLTFKDWADAVVIFSAVFLNSLIGYFQEKKTSQVLSKLKTIIKERTIVIRDGEEKEIEQSNLVPGDIIVLRPGDKIPADAKLLESCFLRVNESILTGEWLVAEKNTDQLSEGAVLAERKNMVYMGTIVESGKGKAIVIATGINTEIGKIAKTMKEMGEEKTPYQKKMISFSGILTSVIVITCVGIFTIGTFSGKSLFEMLITSIAVAVGAIPEGLPVAITVILTLGMERILKQKGLVRKMVAAETLGSTTVICTDKTGTLTYGKMMVSDILADSKSFPRDLALKIGVVCSDAFIENIQEPMGKWKIIGTPTEKAILFAAVESGIKKEEIEKLEPKLDELPFDPVYKYSISLNALDKNREILYIMGAPEMVLEKSAFFETEKGCETISKSKLRELTEKYEEMSSQGLRIVGVAYRKLPRNSLSLEIKKLSELGEISEDAKKNVYEKYLKELVFVAFIILRDSLRDDAKEAIKICQRAGMIPILVTGDHLLTAKAIAKELGIPVEPKNIITGEKFEEISDDEFEKRLREIRVYARMEPRHKLRIVEAWQKKGEIVAMTGDGVNDAPALKKADIGIALGSGTDVAKEASDLILLTDSFSIIVTSIKEGRGIVDNLRKTITLQVSQCFSEIILIGASVIAGLPLPILPAQILWENLIEGSPQGVALGFETIEKDVMERKPESPREPLLNQEMKIIIFGFGIFSTLIILGLFIFLLQKGLPISEIRTVIFAILALDAAFYSLSCKNLKKNIWEYNPFSNPYLIVGILFSIFMLLLGVYVPLFQKLLKTVPLNYSDWVLISVIAIINLVIIEIIKFFFNKKNKI